jgi:hypothetical protein
MVRIKFSARRKNPQVSSGPESMALDETPEASMQQLEA